MWVHLRCPSMTDMMICILRCHGNCKKWYQSSTHSIFILCAVYPNTNTYTRLDLWSCDGIPTTLGFNCPPLSNMSFEEVFFASPVCMRPCISACIPTCLSACLTVCLIAWPTVYSLQSTALTPGSILVPHFLLVFPEWTIRCVFVHTQLHLHTPRPRLHLHHPHATDLKSVMTEPD